MILILHPVFLWISIDFILSRRFFEEDLLTEVIKLYLIFPSLHLMYIALNVYPRKSNSVSSSSLVLSLSLQYAILVLTGCSSSLHSSNLLASFFFDENSFFLRPAVNYSIICIPFKRCLRKISFHPHIKNIM